MKQHLFAIPLVALAMAPIPSLASLALAQKNSCTACHAVETKLVGPAYAEVAKKYKGQKNAEATLIANIKKGGSGKWGAVPMPAQTALSDADAKTLAKWILSIAK
ncbi:MAG: cytochrome c class I [Rhodospirillaceae bacterium]|nr:MAG: cytochrome c class I [Rhodospirillaceae bacterium]